MSDKFHPLANLFPLIEGAAFDELVASVRTGLLERIVVHEDKILEGRNRFRACVAAELFDEDVALKSGMWFQDFSCLHRDIVDRGPLEYVLAKNLARRHLNEEQRRLIGARMVTMGRGRPPEENPALCGIKVADAAKLVNVDRAGVERARTVITKAEPEIVRAIERGFMTVATAVKAAGLEAGMQREIALEAEAGHANVVRTAVKRHGREAREAALGARQRALPDKKYGVILADPEWEFEPRSKETGLDRAADNHYPTSPTEDIAARPVGDIAAEHCVLFLWTTGPKLLDAITVMASWGFAYKSQLVWNKVRVGAQRGTGYWVTGEHELVLIGVRGNVPCPAQGTQWRSNFDAPVAGHSEKPDHIHKLIEAYFPNLPKIELNARAARDGLDTWGFEAPE